MMRPMSRIPFALALAALVGASPAPALAGASNFTLNNGTGAAISQVAIRRAGSSDWKPLSAAPAAGAGGPVQFKDPDCAFDIRAEVAGQGPTTWAGINLCDVKSVTLKRDPSVGVWVDYDE
jgi:hypothetical protein